MATKEGSRKRKDTAYGTLTEERLCALIDEDIRAGVIPLNRANKISRSHYVQLLGCSSTAVSRFKHVFAEYERKSSILQMMDSKVSEVCDWIKAAFEAGDLKITGGRLDRSSIKHHFDPVAVRATSKGGAIYSLFEQLDARAAVEGYLSKQTRQELDKVHEELAGKVTLNKNRLTVDRVALSKIIGITNKRLFADPFTSVIDSHDAEILRKAKASKIDPYFNGRIYVSVVASTPFELSRFR